MKLLFITAILLSSCSENLKKLSGVGTLKATAISVSNDHSCAIREDKTLKCWGGNVYGQLGVGDTFSRGLSFFSALDENSTVKLTTGPRGVLAIALGHSHSCAIYDSTTDASPDALKCWGQNLYGQLGQNNADHVGINSPDDVENLAPIDLGAGAGVIKMIAAGLYHNCALLEGASQDSSLDDQVVCWGQGGNGRLGRGATVNVADNNTPLVPGTSPETRFVPLSTTTTSDVSRDSYPIFIAAGGFHSCAIMRPKTVGVFDGASAPDGEHDFLRCWGSNANGQLGLDNTSVNNIGAGAGNHATEFSDPDNIALLGANLTATGDVKAIALGTNHTCAILDGNTTSSTDDVLRCVGSNSSGQAGGDPAMNTAIDTTAEFSALGNIPLGADKYPKAVFAHLNHTCAVLGDATDIDAANQLKCWGAGNYGKLGNERDTMIIASNSNEEVILAGQREPTIFGGLGINHSCFLLDPEKDAHEVSCFGSNLGGQLGTPTLGSVGDEEDEMGDAPIDSINDVISLVLD